MPALTTALLIAGGTAAAAGIAKGVGQARAAKKSFSDEQRRELALLEERRRADQLGLSEREEGALRARFLAAQSGTERQLQADALQAAAAGGAVSGRDVFLREQAKQSAARMQTQQENLAVADADAATAAAEEARADLLRQQLNAAEAARAQGIATAVSGGLLGISDVAGAAAGQQFQVDLAAAQVPKVDTETLFQQYGTPSGGYTYGGLVPSPYSLTE
tara:strand:+ start:124 stop:780 length:657 start_codon:yes stop_codon:yes gene_type:complete